jgi:thiamine biosynthesis lipoprotein
MSISPGLGRVLALALLLFPSRVGAQEQRFEFAQLHMGMEVRLIVYAADSTVAIHAAAAAFRCIGKLEDIMSDYRDESEVRRLGRSHGQWNPVSRELLLVLREALTIAERSGGAFDPTVGPLIALWREARRTGELPPAGSLARAQARVGWSHVSIDTVQGRVRLGLPEMTLDLGGIAKGFILDAAKAELAAHGVTRALLIAGGDIVAGAAPPGMSGWTVEAPGAGAGFRRLAHQLHDQALATSGDGEQFVAVNGQRYSHVIDPRTGIGLTNGRRAYVMAPSGARADALATALTVMAGQDRAALLAYYPEVVAEIHER